MIATLALACLAAAPPLRHLHPIELSAADTLSVTRVALSHDSRWLATAGRGVHVWSLTASGPPKAMGEGEWAFVQFAPDGRLFAMGHSEAAVWCPGGKLLLRFEASSEQGSSPGSFGLIDGGKALVRNWPTILFDSRTGTRLASHRRRVSRVEVFGPSRLMASLEHQDVDLLDLRTGKLRRTLADHPGEVTAAAIRKDEKEVVTVCVARNGRVLRTEARLWDVATGKEVARYPLGPGEVKEIALSDDGSMLAVTSSAGLVVLGRDGGEMARVESQYHSCAHPVFAPGGGLLAAALDFRPRVWMIRR
jgi:WD40 repeat protein